MSYLFTSESVSEGHPDKVTYQISDEIILESKQKAHLNPNITDIKLYFNYIL